MTIFFRILAASLFKLMARKDRYHEVVRQALIADGWIITDDPYRLRVPGLRQEIDFGAEKIIAAEKLDHKIAVEVKSFIEESYIYEFYKALGQFTSYRINLKKVEPDRIIYLAVPKSVYETFFQIEAIQETILESQMRIVVFDLQTETFTSWIPEVK
jgi:XisH protein